ncbi:transposase [Geminocystis sp. NIES-3709]|uniref:transposase n=1 Tax=Geminocystis sp. NIES-3709 TaxID=1617448 RepID=UPI0005FC4BF5|nr:transposase [Geminocystis sp. NIES-3709]BAQ67134.1 transposase and inactivated derivatives [Geminocystis sp. NIES-3709]
MYQKSEQEKIRLENFLSPSGIELSSDNRWVVMAKLIPWAELEKENSKLFSKKKDQLVKPFRMALGALILKKKMETTDKGIVALIQENPYLQYFIGLSEYTNIAPFKPSMIANFKQNINQKIIDKVHQIIVEEQIKKNLQE